MPPDESHLAPREPCLVVVWTSRAAIHNRIGFALAGQALTIGRKDGQQTFPDDIAMSSVHAAFIAVGPDLVVRDFQSAHGTYVDGTRVRGAARISLATRHVIVAGGTIFVVEPAGDRVPNLLSVAELADASEQTGDADPAAVAEAARRIAVSLTAT